MGVILWIIIGGLAGWIASTVTKTGQGLVMNIIIGLVGSVIGGWVVNGLGVDYDPDRFWPALVVSLIGAILLLFIVNVMFRRR